jgi:trehalose/maltose hydrolase-like predicted phosphorylase
MPNETEIRFTIASSGNAFTVLIASASSFDPGTDVVAAALRELESGSSKGYAALASETSKWWHDFWARGSLRLESPDGTAEFVEANYHYFLYVMGAVRAASSLPNSTECFGTRAETCAPEERSTGSPT